MHFFCDALKDEKKETLYEFINYKDFQIPKELHYSSIYAIRNTFLHNEKDGRKLWIRAFSKMPNFKIA